MRDNLESQDNIRVLIVDDDKRSLEILAEFVSKLGYNVLMSSDGLQAIKRIKEEELDVVLTDLKMPGADGIEVLKVAKETNPDLHVVIITGYASLETTLQAIKEGAYDYITKPFKLDEVAVVLKNLSERIKLEKEKTHLIGYLREAYTELSILKESKTRLEVNLEKINKRMQEDEANITKSIEMLHRIPGNLVPFQYVQKKNDDKVFDRLDKLGKLREEGIISEQEFKIYKERLLTQI